MDCRPYADRLTGDGVCCVAGPGIGRITLRDQLNAVGIRNTAVDQEHRRESGQFLINEEFIATLDYLVAASLWASIVFSRALATYYRQRVSYYKYHDGKEGSRNWKDKLYECLHAWQSRFPRVIWSRKSILADMVQSADVWEVVGFPAGWV